jgi:hypothetical protein
LKRSSGGEGQITGEQVRQFWTQEFPSLNYKTSFDGVVPIANKLGAFLEHPVVRRALTEPPEPLRFRNYMDEGQILIVNLAKGRVGGDIANVLGGMIFSGFAHAAFSRHGTSEPERRSFFIHVDEFHAFTTGALADIVAELRKYGLSLTLANQYLGQIERPKLDALLGNVGTLIAFRTSPNDALDIAHHVDGPEPCDLMAQANYKMFVRLMNEGKMSKPFTAWGKGGMSR